MTLLTVKQAAKRVNRSVRTIERWITDGLQVIWLSNVRYISEEKLLAELRRRIDANPKSSSPVGLEKRRARRVVRNLERTHAEHIRHLLDGGRSNRGEPSKL